MQISGFKYKVDPTLEQAQAFRQFAGVCRVIYNAALYQRETFWRQFKRETGKNIGYVAQARELTALRAEVDWISAVTQTCQQQALKDLDKAFGNFFAGRAKYPTPRRKGVDESFRFQGREVAVERLNRNWSRVRLPKIGWVRFRDTRPMRGVCKWRLQVASASGVCKWRLQERDRQSRRARLVVPVIAFDGEL